MDPNVTGHIASRELSTGCIYITGVCARIVDFEGCGVSGLNSWRRELIELNLTALLYVNTAQHIKQPNECLVGLPTEYVAQWMQTYTVLLEICSKGSWDGHFACECASTWLHTSWSN